MMIQLFAKTDNLWCQEGVTFKERRLYKKSIRREGIKVAVKVAPNGHVSYGNTRVMLGRELAMKYIPIDLMWFLGINSFNVCNIPMLMIRKEVLPGIEGHVMNQRKVIITKPTKSPKFDVLGMPIFDNKMSAYGTGDVAFYRYNSDWIDPFKTWIRKREEYED